MGEGGGGDRVRGMLCCDDKHAQHAAKHRPDQLLPCMRYLIQKLLLQQVLLCVRSSSLSQTAAGRCRLACHTQLARQSCVGYSTNHHHLSAVVCLPYPWKAKHQLCSLPCNRQPACAVQWVRYRTPWSAPGADTAPVAASSLAPMPRCVLTAPMLTLHLQCVAHLAHGMYQLLDLLFTPAVTNTILNRQDSHHEIHLVPCPQFLEGQYHSPLAAGARRAQQGRGGGGCSSSSGAL